jgi:hypothetical protein
MSLSTSIKYFTKNDFGYKKMTFQISHGQCTDGRDKFKAKPAIFR